MSNSLPMMEKYVLTLLEVWSSDLRDAVIFKEVMRGNTCLSMGNRFNISHSRAQSIVWSIATKIFPGGALLQDGFRVSLEHVRIMVAVRFADEKWRASNHEIIKSVKSATKDEFLESLYRRQIAKNVALVLMLSESTNSLEMVSHDTAES